MTTYSPAAIHSPGTLLHKRYQLDLPIAVGGMAEVWKGTDRILKRDVAIKVLHPHLAADGDVSERFRREAISVARLSHPNIVPTFDAGNDDHDMFIVQGLINGPSMARVLESRHFLPVEAASLGRQVADALDHAHAHDLIHRDIKPSNLLLVDHERRVLVTDFGIAKALAETTDANKTLPGVTLITKEYAAPEQLKANAVSPQTDIYSLGVVLHEMVCGHIGSDKPTEITVLHDHSLTQHAGCTALPEALRVVITKATAEEPENRYASASDMRDALADAVTKLATPVTTDSTPAISFHEAPPLQYTTTTTTTVAGAQAPDYVASAAQRLEIEQARQSMERLWRRTLVVVSILLFVAVLLGVLIGAALRNDGPRRTAATPRVAAQTHTPTSATSFDPDGDGQENQSTLAQLFDSNPRTTWSTESYSSSTFGNLKPGVGFIVRFKEPQNLSRIELDSSSPSWAAEVYSISGTQSAGTTLTEWGKPAGAVSGTGVGTTQIPVSITGTNSVLIWFTNLGSNNRIVLSDVRYLG